MTSDQNATNVSASIAVDAPAQAIFDLLADPRQHAVLDGSGMLQGSTSGPERLGLGSRFGMDMKLGTPYQVTNTVVEFEEGRLIAWRHRAPHRWRYELAAAPGGGTTVTETWDISRWPALGRLGLRLVGYPGKTLRSIEKSLTNLKLVAEQSVHTG